MNDTLESRITELEIRLAHQEDTLIALNQAVVGQRQTIDELKLQMEALRLRLAELLASSGGDHTPEPPPPHY